MGFLKEILQQEILIMEQTKVNAPLTSAARSRRKWRSTDERKAELEERRKRLERRKRQVEARIAALDPRDKIAARKRDTRANIVLGAVLRAHMALNPSFGTELAHILDNNLKRPPDRQLLASVLGMSQLTVPSPPPCPLPDQKLRHLVTDITARQTRGASDV